MMALLVGITKARILGKQKLLGLVCLLLTAFLFFSLHLSVLVLAKPLCMSTEYSETSKIFVPEVDCEVGVSC
jgi:hypothetical protein